MALSTESAGLVRQRVRESTRNPGIFHLLKAFFLNHAANKKNADLGFYTYTAAGIADASGQALVNAACKVYAVYGKKANTATDVYLVILDDATNDAGGATDARLSIAFLAAEDEQLFVNPNGIAMAAGVVAKAYTDYDGTTDSTASDCPTGFVIVGAP